MCSLITPILLAIETVTDMKPEEARKPAKFTPKFIKHTKLSNMFLKTTTFKRRIIFQTKRKQSISAQNSISTKCLFSARKYFPPMHLFAEKPFSHKILQNWSFLGRLWITSSEQKKRCDSQKKSQKARQSKYRAKAGRCWLWIAVRQMFWPVTKCGNCDQLKIWLAWWWRWGWYWTCW